MNYSPESDARRDISREGGLTAESSEFPDDPMDRLGSVLAGGVNFGPKSGLLLLFPPYGEYIDPEDLTKKFRENIEQTGTSFDSIRADTVRAYCEYSFVHVGLVATMLEMNSGGVPELIGYMLTEAGARYGVRAAAVALLFEYYHDDISIYEALGHTATSSGKDIRAAHIRSGIMIKLLNHPEGIYSAQLYQDDPQMPSGSTDEAMNILEKQGLIERNSYDMVSELHFSRGSRVASDITPPAHYKEIYTAALTESELLLGENQAFTIRMLTNRIYPKFESRWGEGAFKKTLRRLVRDMVTQEFLVRRDTTWATGHGDMVKLSKKGAAVGQDLFIPLYGLFSDDPEAIQMIDRDIVPLVRENFGKCLRAAVLRYYPHSQGYLGRVRNKLDAKVLSFISQSNKGLDRKEIAELMDQNAQTIEKRIGRLVRTNLIKELPGDYPRKRYIANSS